MAALIASAGLTTNSAAARAKGSQPQLHRYLAGESTEPKRSTLQPFARLFQIPVEAFYNEALAARIARERGLSGTARAPVAPPYQAAGSAIVDYGAEDPCAPKRQLTVPVVGLIQAGEDGYLEESAPPAGNGGGEALLYYGNDANAYALRVRGDSMANRIMSGDHIVVDPNATPQPGDIAVVILKDGRRTIRRLLYIRDGEVTLAPFSDDHRTLLLPLGDIDEMHKVVSIIPR